MAFSRLTLVLVCALLAPARVQANAPAAADESARVHHEQGRAAVAGAKYEEAIAEFRRAYELKADPSFLFDIAESYRALGVPERAVFFYRRYLSLHADPPNRPEVERQIALLEPKPLGRAAPPIAAVAPMPADFVIAAPARSVSEGERSVIGRWWFWTAVGALAAAGATVAILASTRSDTAAMLPDTTLGNARVEF